VTAGTLRDRVAVVTGAARGIGLAIARRLAVDGTQVIVWDRDLTPLADSGFAPDAAEVVDVTNYVSVERAFKAAVARFGQVHILINNAGVNGLVAPAEDYPLDEFARVLAVDLTGVFHCCRAAIGHMKANRYGRIVNIASIAGKEGMPGISAYSAAKAGVIGYSKAIARELATSGITVNCVAPAITQTELFQEMTQAHIDAALARIPMGRFCTPDEIAAVVAFAASDDCSFTTGFVFDATGGRATY
jgi:NAD(P)-dependent dehydrogenase (short-subunit alcohol dehydrogenase family)